MKSIILLSFACLLTTTHSMASQASSQTECSVSDCSNSSTYFRLKDAFDRSNDVAPSDVVGDWRLSMHATWSAASDTFHSGTYGEHTVSFTQTSHVDFFTNQRGVRASKFYNYGHAESADVSFPDGTACFTSSLSLPVIAQKNVYNVQCRKFAEDRLICQATREINGALAETSYQGWTRKMGPRP